MEQGLPHTAAIPCGQTRSPSSAQLGFLQQGHERDATHCRRSQDKGWLRNLEDIKELSPKRIKINANTDILPESFKMFIKNIFLFACKHSPATLTAQIAAMLGQCTTARKGELCFTLLHIISH